MSAGTERGFTLVELLVTMTLVSLISVGMYQVMFNGSRGSDTARNVARVSEEARAGLNRMVRDAREADSILRAGDDGFRVLVDFDGDGTPGENPNQAGDFEDVTFFLDNPFGPEADILIGVGPFASPAEVLVDNVECVGGFGSCVRPVFEYTSNKLEYDWDGDGVTTGLELDQATSAHGVNIGNNNGVVDGTELDYVTGVSFGFNLTQGNRDEDFFAEAVLRNRR